MALFHKAAVQKVYLDLDFTINPFDYRAIAKKLKARKPNLQLIFKLAKTELSEFDISKIRIIQTLIQELKIPISFQTYSRSIYLLLRPFNLDVSKIAKINTINTNYVQNEVLTPNQEWNFLKDILLFWKKNPLFLKLHFSFNQMLRLGIFVLAILSFTIYITNPKAEIVFEPRSNRIEQVIKLNLNQNQPTSLQLKPELIQNLQKTYAFQAKQKVRPHSVPSYQATIFNFSTEPIEFKPFTAFISERGLKYRNQNFISVAPASSPEEPGLASLQIKPDLYSQAEAYVGQNIGLKSGTKITHVSQPKAYIQLEQAIPNMSSKHSYQLSNLELASSLDFATTDFQQNSFEYIKEHLQAQNINTNFTLLNHDSFIDILEISHETNTQSLEQDGTYQLTIKPKIAISLVDQSKLFKLIKTFLRKQTTPNYTLSSIDFKNINLDKTSALSEGANQVEQLIFNVFATETFDTKQIAAKQEFDYQKSLITNLTVDQAKTELDKHRDLRVLEIQIHPFWSPTLPANKDNINISYKQYAK